MNHYLCAWNDKRRGDSAHTVIKQGQLAVETWLKVWLTDAKTGCPIKVICELSTLDADAGHGQPPIRIVWEGKYLSFSITEITDLGVFSSDMWVAIDKVSFKIIVDSVASAHRWLNWRRGPTISSAETSLARALALLGGPLDG